MYIVQPFSVHERVDACLNVPEMDVKTMALTVSRFPMLIRYLSGGEVPASCCLTPAKQILIIIVF